MIVTTVLRLGELMVRFGEGYIRGGLILDGGCVCLMVLVDDRGGGHSGTGSWRKSFQEQVVTKKSNVILS